VNQRPLERHALPHPARERRHRVVGARAEAGPLQRLVGGVRRFRHRVQAGKELQVLAGGELGIQEEIVPEHADSRAQGGALRVGHGAVADAPRRRAKERRQDGEQRGLPCSVRAEDAVDLALGRPEADARQRAAAAERPRHLFDADVGEIERCVRVRGFVAHAATPSPPPCGPAAVPSISP
jgi:hypothetical protein